MGSQGVATSFPSPLAPGVFQQPLACGPLTPIFVSVYGVLLMCLCLCPSFPLLTIYGPPYSSTISL